MRKIFVPLIVVFIAVLTLCFEWPLSKIIITATFGESRGDHFHTGIDFAGEEAEIKPIAAGEVVFRFAMGESFSSVPVGLGSYVVLEDKTGIRSLYAHIKKGTIPLDKKRFELNETLGIVGDTGYSLGKHLHLTIIDHKEKTILNPLVLYKNEGKETADKKPPVINDLFYKDNAGGLIKFSDDTLLNQEKIEVLVSGFDVQDNSANPLAPYEIVVERNEMKITDIVFNALQFKDDEYRLNSCGKSFADLFVNDTSFTDLINLGKIDLIKGKNVIRVSLIDFNGNTTAREINIWVGSPP
jgi:murein DD-endopeptidase MepM/ murein hydrolase activator NlpD